MMNSRIAIIALSIFPVSAYAYVDPNVGGWLYQMLFPVLIAIAGAWSMLRQRLKGFVGRFFNKKNKDVHLAGEIAKYGTDTKE